MNRMGQVWKRYAALALSAAMVLGTTACDEDKEDKGGGIAVTGVTVEPTTLSIEVGKTAELVVSVFPTNADNKNYTLTSDNTAVATVSGNVVTAVAVGTATVTAKTADGGKTATCAVTVTEPFDGIVATGAAAYYLGDQYQTGFDNTILALTSGNAVTHDMTVEGDGTMLWLDLNVTKSGQKNIPAGTYTALPDDIAEGYDQSFTFLKGVDMGAWGLMGTFIYELAEGAPAADAVYTLVVDGEVVIAVEGETYTITANVKTDDGQDHAFRYVGPIAEAPNNGGDEPTPPDAVVVTGLTQGEMDYCGQAYGDTGTDYANWSLYLAGEGFNLETLQGPGPMVQIEINTSSADTTDLPAGTYTVMEVLQNDAFVPFSSLPAFIQDGYCYGTWYFSDDQPIYGATEGSVTISKSGDKYTIDFSFKDADTGGAFEGTYTGPLSYLDVTQLSQAGASAKVGLSKRAPVLKAPAAARHKAMFRK